MGKLIVAVQLPRWGKHAGHGLDSEAARVSLWHLRWMEAGSGTSVTMFEGGCSTLSNIIRIPAGAEMLTANRCDGGDVSFVTSSRRKPYLAPHLPF